MKPESPRLEDVRTGRQGNESRQNQPDLASAHSLGSVLGDITYSPVHLACVGVCADITNCSEKNCFRALGALVADQQVLAEIETGEYSLITSGPNTPVWVLSQFEDFSFSEFRRDR